MVYWGAVVFEKVKLLLFKTVLALCCVHTCLPLSQVWTCPWISRWQLLQITPSHWCGVWSRVPSTITGSPARPLLESPLRYCLSTYVGKKKKSTRLAFIKPIQIRKHSLHVSADSAQRCYHHHPDSARPRDWVHHHCGGKKRTATKQHRHDRRLHRWGEQSGSFCRERLFCAGALLWAGYELTPPLQSNTFAVLSATNWHNYYYYYWYQLSGAACI